MNAREFYEKTHAIDLGVVLKEECIKLMYEYANQQPKPEHVCGRCGIKEGLVVRCSKCFEELLNNID